MIASKDFWAGLMFIGFAAFFYLTGAGLKTGTAGAMGPGFFPAALSLVLAGLGLVIWVRALFAGDRSLTVNARPLLVLLVALIVFAALVTRAGLVLTTFLVAAIGAFAGHEFKLREVAALAVFLCLFTLIIFVYALGMPLPVWPKV